MSHGAGQNHTRANAAQQSVGYNEPLRQGVASRKRERGKAFGQQFLATKTLKPQRRGRKAVDSGGLENR